MKYLVPANPGTAVFERNRTLDDVGDGQWRIGLVASIDFAYRLRV